MGDKSLMLWIKAFHVIFVTAWFAGLIYLPRFYINLALETEPAARARLLLMARKLFRFATLISVPAISFGLWLWLIAGIERGPGSGWLHAKLGLVFLLIAYHTACGILLIRFDQGRAPRHAPGYRIFNELPMLIFSAIVVLVVVKPFKHSGAPPVHQRFTCPTVAAPTKKRIPPPASLPAARR